MSRIDDQTCDPVDSQQPSTVASDPLVGPDPRPRISIALERLTRPIDRLFNAVYGTKWNPLYTAHEVRMESWSKFISEAYWNVELAK
jgi:hypothetical protein